MNTHTSTYSGRTVDLLLLKTVLEPTVDKIVYPTVQDSPMMTSGIEKLVQRYTLLFLTIIGTVVNSPSEGTEFMKSLGTGNIYDENTLAAAASKANLLVTSQIRGEDANLTTADDEKLENADILETQVDRSRASVMVKVKLTTAAGTSYVYTTPVTMGI